MWPALASDRVVTPEPLNVAPDLVGRPLAPPARRAAAMALDLGVVALLSSLSNLWLGLGLLLVALQLRSAGSGGTSRWRRAAGWLLVALFVGLAAREVWQGWRDRQAGKPAPAAEARAAEADGEKTAAEALHGIGEGLPDAERIKLLEAALVSMAKDRKPKATSVSDEVERLVDAVGASFGWGVVYFSLLPAFWPGQTIGKKLFKLQAVELTGKPMTVMRSLKRYGGYAAGMATGGLGFTQLLWDPNRQAIQDRAAHTVVIDLRAPPPSA